MQDNQDPHPAFICPITNDLFTDPVIAEDGHTYQRVAITDWLKKNSTSPQTRIKMSIQNLKPNQIVKSMMKQFYKFQQQAKQLKDKNVEFSDKFSVQINQLPKDKLDKEYQKIINNLDMNAFICPLTKKIFQQPVIASDNITYQKKAIEKWLQTNDNSPVKKQKLQKNSLLPNHTTKSMIDLFKLEEKQWKNLKNTEKQILHIFAPKIKQILQIEVLNIDRNAAKKLLTNWEDNVNIRQQKEIILKKQVELNAYSLKDDKYKFQIPCPIPTFVGRQKELNMIDKILSIQDIVCLIGNGGMGKTQLATQFIKRSRFPSVIWLHGQNKLLIFQIQTYMKKAHNENLQNEKNQNILMEKFYQILGPKALVIIDNVENSEQIKDYLPRNGSIKVILTSRYKNWEYSTVELQQFTQDDTQKYFQKAFSQQSRKITHQQMNSLSDLLGGIPLAISQAVACIKLNKDLTVQKYIELFKKSQSQSLTDNIDEKMNHVYTTLILALHNVQKYNNQVNLIIDVIGYMSPEKLNKHLILMFLESQDKVGFSKGKIKKLKQVFKVLCDYFIISQNHKTDQNIFSINRLTQSVIRMIHKKNGSFQIKYNQLGQWLLQNMYYDERDPNDVERVMSFIPHGLAIANIQNTIFFKRKNQLLRQIGYHQYYAKKNYLQSKICLQNALEVTQTKTPSFDNREMYVQILNDLGCVNGSMGNSQIQVKLQQSALKISEQYLGKNSMITSQILNNLGRAYGELKEYCKQKNTLQRALQIKEKYLKLDKNHISISRTLIHLATAYGNIGDSNKKKELLLRALGISERHYGKNHPANNVILMNLANANRSLGDIQQSIQALQKSLKKVQKQFGNQHSDYALAAFNLGASYQANRDSANAKLYFQKSLQIYQKQFGPNNQHTLKVLQILRVIENNKQSDQFQIDSESEQEFQSIDKTNLNKQVQNSPQSILKFIDDFSQSISKQKRQHIFSNQRLVSEQIDKYVTNIFLGKNKPKKNQTLESLMNLSKKFTQKGFDDQCENLIILGKKEVNQGNFKKAIEIYQKALILAQKQRGKDHFTIGVFLNILGMAYNQIQNYNKSFQHLNRALKINSNFFGQNSQTTATTVSNLGAAYTDIGQFKQAQIYCRKGYEIMLKIHGPYHKSTIDTLYNLRLTERKIKEQQNTIPKYKLAK